ncbi:hypothetical protein HDF15_000388 [Granulicella mallensis]|uniref:Uncharacterized protein n=1 Tax=Granulicella mallensis TaxID=940614 RepID=A0A7W7ZLH2_9BACT|nr:hypothetical protein [Granulicella mallensis]
MTAEGLSKLGEAIDDATGSSNIAALESLDAYEYICGPRMPMRPETHASLQSLPREFYRSHKA